MIIQLSLQLTLPTITSDYLVPCGETHLTHSKIFKKNSKPPPPYISFQQVQVSCHLSIFLLSLGGNNFQFKF